MNSLEMKVTMKRNQDTLEKLAEALNVQISGVSARVNGKIDFRAKEIAVIKERYHLSPEEVCGIFF